MMSCMSSRSRQEDRKQGQRSVVIGDETGRILSGIMRGCLYLRMRDRKSRAPEPELTSPEV